MFAKKIVKNHKLKISKLQNSTFVRTAKKIQKTVWKDSKAIWGRSSVLKVLAPIGSHVNMVNTKTKKNPEKFEIAFFLKKNMSGGIAQGKPQLKFERNLRNRFWDNCDTDDGQRPHTMSSADVVKQG